MGLEAINEGVACSLPAYTLSGTLLREHFDSLRTMFTQDVGDGREVDFVIASHIKTCNLGDSLTRIESIRSHGNVPPSLMQIEHPGVGLSFHASHRDQE